MKNGRFTPGGLYLSIMSALLIAAVIFGVTQYRARGKYENQMSAMYQGKLLSVAACVNSAAELMNKLDAVAPSERIPIYAEIWKQAGAAHENLNDLPYNQSLVSPTLKFLAQLSDFSFSMIKAAAEGYVPSSEDGETLAALKDYALSCSSELNLIAARVSLGTGIDWKAVSAEQSAAGNGQSAAALLGSISQVSEVMRGYPEVIYDGPFSDHLKKAEPAVTIGKSLVSAKEAEEACRDFFGGDDIVESVRLVSETTDENNTLPVYSFELKLKGQSQPGVYMDVTKRGGYVLWMLNSGYEGPSAENSISVKDALAKAESFLAQLGYYTMKYNYYDLSGTSIVFSFTCYDDGIIKYPDLVKLKLSLATGEVIGFDARGYVNSHRERELPDKILLPEEAATYLEGGMLIFTSEKAVIPLTNGGGEAFCYEFLTEKNGRRYLIYINTTTGKMENIFELSVNEYGVTAK